MGAHMHTGAGAGVPKTKLMADINITPMVDVMLVLLVIFMVTAPLLLSGVPVDLPRNAGDGASSLRPNGGEQHAHHAASDTTSAICP